MSCYNACGECKVSEELSTQYIKCSKKDDIIYRFMDTSECKDFEPKERER